MYRYNCYPYYYCMTILLAVSIFQEYDTQENVSTTVRSPNWWSKLKEATFKFSHNTYQRNRYFSTLLNWTPGGTIKMMLPNTSSHDSKSTILNSTNSSLTTFSSMEFNSTIGNSIPFNSTTADRMQLNSTIDSSIPLNNSIPFNSTTVSLMKLNNSTINSSIPFNNSTQFDSTIVSLMPFNSTIASLMIPFVSTMDNSTSFNSTNSTVPPSPTSKS